MIVMNDLMYVLILFKQNRNICYFGMCCSREVNFILNYMSVQTCMNARSRKLNLGFVENKRLHS